MKGTEHIFLAGTSSLFSLLSQLMAQKQEHLWDSESGRGLPIYVLFCLDQHIYCLGRVKKWLAFRIVAECLFVSNTVCPSR